MRNPYLTLGVARNASRREIVAAYRRLAMKWHPDRNPGNEREAARQFRKIRSAYDALSRAQRDGAHDEPRGETYDGARGGMHDDPHDEARARPPHAPAPDVADPDAYVHRASPAAPFASPASSAIRPTNVPGVDLRRVLCVPLEVALGGGEVAASFRVTEPCEVCKGAGTQVIEQRCDTCGNSGELDDDTCRACDGNGTTGHVCACTACRSAGKRDYSRRVVVAVPPAAWDGQTLVVKGEGALGWSGGPRGDAVFSVRIVCPPEWMRLGPNLMGDLPVDYATAALGGACDVEVLGRRIAVEIPRNCPPGKWLSLEGEALGGPSGQRGCLYLRVTFSLPQYG
ncbi:DnaJ C-terminal domain-containing protein [Paraburkholderia caballeronis]|uniref:DnaJ C-terminal domain-containing protein n=1 Tax=Paraburkholderia caballeronis TaxID=416943 RepID=UPI001064B12C|nr:DnaJ C-terminal domain-containing protein [Paraburkholderia caballeronis]TDV09446.1 molecular chaperone DnaJ [Paraburkholderia caballeronis]TDV13717.1 molecular chaperone DnaJ [Paraburkholderia caballeronis]TDV22899.1 molecular chaperone DnaJ [Paraburkholderia caballeronis]